MFVWYVTTHGIEEGINVSEDPAASIFTLKSTNLRMETAGSPKTSILNYQPIQHHTHEYRSLRIFNMCFQPLFLYNSVGFLRV